MNTLKKPVTTVILYQTILSDYLIRYINFMSISQTSQVQSLLSLLFLPLIISA